MLSDLIKAPSLAAPSALSVLSSVCLKSSHSFQLGPSATGPVKASLTGGRSDHSHLCLPDHPCPICIVFQQPPITLLQTWLFYQPPKLPTRSSWVQAILAFYCVSFPLLNFVPPWISYFLKIKFELLIEANAYITLSFIKYTCYSKIWIIIWIR